MTLSISVDLAACQGYACCLMEAPSLFDLDEVAGKVVVLEPHPSDAQRSTAEAAVRSCPAKALTLDEG